LKTGERQFGRPLASKGSMPLARITSQGLAAIALLVAALWGCILAENSITRSASLTRIASLQELRMLRSAVRKVNTPIGVWHRQGRA
jgi:hypothetical protein